MKKVDYHIHTIYSGHSDENMTVENIIVQAKKMKLDEIAITEHSFDWHLGPKGNLKLIHQEVAKFATDSLKVFVGMEIDPDSKNIGKLIFEDFDKKDIYPLLVGTHGFPGLERGWFESFVMTPKEKSAVYSTWFNMMEKIIARGIVDVLAHPGRIIMQNEIITEFNSNVLADFKNLFITMKENNTAFEINETLLQRMPNERLAKSYQDLVQLVIDMNLKISIGSDAHSLDKIGDFKFIESPYFAYISRPKQ